MGDVRGGERGGVRVIADAVGLGTFVEWGMEGGERRFRV